MKALSIDGAISRLTVSAKNDDKIFTSIYDIGMRQSESLVPAIDYVLQKVDLKSSDLDYTCISIGPGSFTGLRLAISAVKAIELAYNVPVYGISTLEMYAHCFKDFDVPVLACVDANKDRFYARISRNEKILLADDDWPLEELYKKTKKIKKLIVAGPDRNKLSDLIKAQNKKIELLVPAVNIITTEALFDIAEKNIAAKVPPLKDFDGPVYLRASEAEIKQNQQN